MGDVIRFPPPPPKLTLTAKHPGPPPPELPALPSLDVTAADGSVKAVAAWGGHQWELRGPAPWTRRLAERLETFAKALRIVADEAERLEVEGA